MNELEDTANQKNVDAETLRLFVEKVNKLRKSSFARRMFTERSGFTISWNQEEFTTEVRGPDDESIEAMVLTLRLKMHDNDRRSVRNIAKVMERYKGGSGEVERFLDARKELNKFLDNPITPTLNVNGKGLKNIQILHGVIYGELAHLDEQKRKEMVFLREHPFMSAVVDNTFNVIVARYMDFLFYMQLQAQALYERLTGKSVLID